MFTIRPPEEILKQKSLSLVSKFDKVMASTQTLKMQYLGELWFIRGTSSLIIYEGHFLDDPGYLNWILRNFQVCFLFECLAVRSHTKCL